MGKIPITGVGLTEAEAIEAGTLLREGWDVLRSLQFNKKASILRYTVTQEGKPHLGIDDQKELVPGLADLDVYVSRVSTREVLASNGKVELTDTLFIFYEEVKETDEILYDGKTYKVVQLKYYDPDIGRSMVIGRVI
jgi:hypothetical protein